MTKKGLNEWQDKMKEMNGEYHMKYKEFCLKDKTYWVIYEYKCKKCNVRHGNYSINGNYPMNECKKSGGIYNLGHDICRMCSNKFIEYPKKY